MDVDLSLTLPVYSHTDEGRTYKHAALWLLSTMVAWEEGVNNMWIARRMMICQSGNA